MIPPISGYTPNIDPNQKLEDMTTRFHKSPNEEKLTKILRFVDTNLLKLSPTSLANFQRYFIDEKPLKNPLLRDTNQKIKTLNARVEELKNDRMGVFRRERISTSAAITKGLKNLLTEETANTPQEKLDVINRDIGDLLEASEEDREGLGHAYFNKQKAKPDVPETYTYPIQGDLYTAYAIAECYHHGIGMLQKDEPEAMKILFIIQNASQNITLLNEAAQKLIVKINAKQ